MPRILNEKIVFNDWFNVEEARIAGADGSYSRMRLNQPKAAAVLVLNTDSRRFILIKQFRYAISATHAEPLLEVVAGRVDKGESPAETALRECREEIGYDISPGKLQFATSCFASPGYTSERVYLYYAEACHADKTGAGGGLKDENEELEIVEIDEADFIRSAKAGTLEDAKTALLGLWLLSRRTETTA